MNDATTGTALPTITTNILFAPQGEDLLEYDDDDYERICAQQPLPFEDLPAYLFKKSSSPFFPPILWCGWRVDPDSFFKTLLNKFPEAGVRHPEDTIINSRVFCAIMAACQIPDRYARLLHLVLVLPQGRSSPVAEPDHVLSIGSTITAVMPRAIRENIARMLVPEGTKLEWYLDHHNWYWDYDDTGARQKRFKRIKKEKGLTAPKDNEAVDSSYLKSRVLFGVQYNN